MSNKANRIKKSVGKLGGGLKFPIEMYNTTVGSIVICCLMFTKKDVDYKKIRATWRKFKAAVEKGEEPFDIEKASFVDDVLKYFGLHRPVYFPVAMVSSGFNVLFAPYDKKYRRVLPLREDGFAGPTLKYGKVYPIQWHGIVRNRIWLKEKIKSIFKRDKKDAALQGK
jgi:hypothetical protein